MSALEKLEKKIARHVGRAVHDFGMIEAGDRIMVALSGGKDSWTLLHALNRLRARAPVEFEVAALSVDPGFPDFPLDRATRYCREKGWTHLVEKADMAGIIEEKLTPGTSPCSFCARLRRGVLYSAAKREGFNKIALGHHADDLIETLLMAQFFTGEIKSMPPVLHADDGVNTIIRPLCYVFEADITAFTPLAGFPVIDCACPGFGDEDRQRVRTKRLLADLEAEHPGIKANLLSSLGRVRPRYLMTSRPEKPSKVLVKSDKS